MSNNLDSIIVELVVTACQAEANNIWMQGGLEISLNNEKPYTDSDIIDIDEFLKSLEQDGEFFIFSCHCGLPECSGWELGIQVLHLEENIKWTNPNNGKTWCFSKQKITNDLINIREEIANYKQFFSQKDIAYVGVGYNW
ncbi:hypothetical protein [Pedobacter caeni]|uniref:Uncharacterized protein n=1 Tax=Pedobacter caeni TaxID=288992 RepID=A0A1M4V9X1_9SPHI|nr:hypothetical protein [Pedobacter caeni]SHE65806.1 hypothetical protein SAMN04488522_101835 [Pedobacter caeni]